MALEVKFSGKPGPSRQRAIITNNILRNIGCFYDPVDEKIKSSDDNSSFTIGKGSTNFSIKFYSSVLEGNDVPATPSSELVVDDMDFLVKSAGSTIMTASTAGSGGPGAPYGDGSVSTPSVAFTDETNTGFYRVGPDNLALSINGINRFDFQPSLFKVTADNTGATEFGQLVVRGSTDSTKYVSLCLDTTNNLAFIQAGKEGTGTYSLVLCRNAGSSVLVGTTSNTYSTRLFVNGSIGFGNSLQIKDGTDASPSIRFNSATDTGLFYNDAVGDEIGTNISVAGTTRFTTNNNAVSVNSLKLKSTNSNGVELKTPGSLSASYSLVLPDIAGPEGKCFAVNGSGICSWITPYFGLFGPGVDGDVTIGVDTTLTRDMFYNNLTINGNFVINTNSFRIYVKGTLTIGPTTLTNGVIRAIGNNGNNATSNTGAAAPTANNSGSLNAMGNGGAGGAGGTTTGTQGATNSSPTNPAMAGAGGTSGAGGTGSSGAGGAQRTSGTASEFTINFLEHSYYRSASQHASGHGGGGGSGGGGNGANPGGGGGSGGNSGGVVRVFANIITIDPTAVAPIFLARGGNGGNGFSTANTNCGGGGGGGGGAAGIIIIFCNKVTNAPPANWIRIQGGNGGNGGNGNGTGTGGQGGGGGSAYGAAMYGCISRNTYIFLRDTSSTYQPTAPVAASGATGGTGNTGVIHQTSSY